MSMLWLLFYIIGAFIAVLLPNEIVKLGYKTLGMVYEQSDKSFFSKDEDDDDLPEWCFKVMTFGLSWLSVLAIYVTTIIYLLLINKPKTT